MNTNKLRMPLDILMTILSVILMGGTMLFPDDSIHQICGIALVVMWAVHIILNRHWYALFARANKKIISTNANERSEYGSLFKGKYQPFRIMQLVVNCGVLICAMLLATVLHYVREGVVAMGAPCRPQRSEDGER